MDDQLVTGSPVLSDDPLTDGAAGTDAAGTGTGTDTADPLAPPKKRHHHHADGEECLSSDHEDPELYDEGAVSDADSEADPDQPKPMAVAYLRKLTTLAAMASARSGRNDAANRSGQVGEPKGRS